jgi:hypothetical protein
MMARKAINEIMKLSNEERERHFPENQAWRKLKYIMCCGNESEISSIFTLSDQPRIRIILSLQWLNSGG